MLTLGKLAALCGVLAGVSLLIASPGLGAPRDLPSGDVDKSWGNKGLQLFPRVGQSQVVEQCAVGADNTLLLMASRGRIRRDDLAGERPTLAKLTSAGRIDRRFGGNGVLEALPAKNAFANAVLGDAKGRTYVLASWTGKRGKRPSSIRIIRLTRSGRLDRSWGRQGVVTLAGNLRSGVFSLVDDRIVVGVALNPTLITTLGPTGNVEAVRDHGFATFVQYAKDGGWFVARTVRDPNGNQTFNVERYSQDGTLVTGWADNGVFSVSSIPTSVLGLFGIDPSAQDQFVNHVPGPFRSLEDGSVSMSVSSNNRGVNSWSWALRLDPSGKQITTFGSGGFVALGVDGAVGDSGGDYSFSLSMPDQLGGWANAIFSSLDLDNEVYVRAIPSAGGTDSNGEKIVDMKRSESLMGAVLTNDGKRAIFCGNTYRKRPARFNGWAFAVRMR